MRWWGLESEQQSAAERYREAKEWWHSAFRAFCFELHASASSAFHSKQQSLLLCLGAKILPRGHPICFGIRFTWSSLLKSSAWTKDGHPLLASSYTFSHPSLNIRTHFLTMPSLIALSPYTWKVCWWFSLGSTFLAFKKRITDHSSQSAAPSVVSNMFNTQKQT